MDPDRFYPRYVEAGVCGIGNGGLFLVRNVLRFLGWVSVRKGLLP